MKHVADAGSFFSIAHVSNHGNFFVKHGVNAACFFLRSMRIVL